MIPVLELHQFYDSDSDSRKKWNHNTYRYVMIPRTGTDSRIEFFIMAKVPIPVQNTAKNGITALLTYVTQKNVPSAVVYYYCTWYVFLHDRHF